MSFKEAHTSIYLRRRLASGECIVTLGVALCACVCAELLISRNHVSTARCISLGGEGNALYPMLSSFRMRLQQCSLFYLQRKTVIKFLKL